MSLYLILAPSRTGQKVNFCTTGVILHVSQLKGYSVNFITSQYYAWSTTLSIISFCVFGICSIWHNAVFILRAVYGTTERGGGDCQGGFAAGFFVCKLVKLEFKPIWKRFPQKWVFFKIQHKKFSRNLSSILARSTLTLPGTIRVNPNFADIHSHLQLLA